jgi:urease accessory protein
MEIIHHAIAIPADPIERIPLEVERGTLAKRRWRAVASDGREFGFDLEHPLADGAIVLEDGGRAYVISQKAEPVLVVQLQNHGAHGPAELARLGWIIGNLHFPLALNGEAALVPDDPALRQLFERERIAFTASEQVFKPVSGGHSHSHDDDHHH